MIGNHRVKRTAQSLLEFALIAPLFFLILLGTIEGGRLLWTMHTVSHVTKEGARYTTVRGSGSIHADAPATESMVKSRMLEVSSGLNSSDLNVNIVLLDGNMDDRSLFRIESTYQHHFIVATIFNMDSTMLKASSTDLFWRSHND